MTTRRFAAAAVVLLTALMGACGDNDVVTAAYATLSEAEQAGAIARGWIPSGLPPSTHDIREAHDIDSNRRWGLFSFTPGEAAILSGQLTPPEEGSPAKLRCEIPARIEWWPVLLRGALDTEQLKAAGLSAYRTRDGNLIVLVNWKQGRAYYWSS